MKSKLPVGYVIKEMSKDEFAKLFEKHAPEIFSDNLDYDSNDVDSEDTREQFRALCKKFVSPTQYCIYTYLMSEVVRRASTEGFASIFSRHIMTNNDIIISKL